MAGNGHAWPALAGLKTAPWDRPENRTLGPNPLTCGPETVPGLMDRKRVGPKPLLGLWIRDQTLQT